MKKILGIVVLGLILTSCIDQDEKLLENCADYRTQWGEIYNKKPLNEKLKDLHYEGNFNICERELKNYPKKFKAKYRD